MLTNTLSIDVNSARQYIENHLDKRQVNKIQHSFPSPRYWTETDVPVAEVLDDRQRLPLMGRGSVVNLYVGVPYCIKTNPGKCGYCLFPVEEFTGYDALQTYFEYLKREAAMYKTALRGHSLGAVYFGGGTSNLYKDTMYPQLMEVVRDLFPIISPEVDITLEGIPQLFTREKMRTIKECGMNRVSVGVQQINERLNSLSGRKQTTKHVTQTLEWAREFGLACNVDLIFGWPQQTVSTMVQDLETVISWGVHDITHYELNVGGPTDFALNRYHELPSTLANLEMYRVARDLLTSHGYQQITAYNWRKPGDPVGRRYEEGVTRRFDSMDTVGLGYAAITFFGDVTLEDGRSWSYINWRKINEYKAAIDAGRFPVECGFRHERADFQISMVFRNLFGLELDRTGFQIAFGVDVYDQFAGVWDALAEWDFIKITPEKIRLTGDGPFYTPMIQTLLAEQRYRQLRERGQRRNAQQPSRSDAAAKVQKPPVSGQREREEKPVISSPPAHKQNGSAQLGNAQSAPVPIIALSSAKDWRLEEQDPYVRHVTPYKGLLYQRMGLDKTFVRGAGCYLFDRDGIRYADFIAQYGALPFGHNPQSIWRALDAVRKEERPNLAIASISPAAGELAERLIALAPPGLAHVVFANSGAEAVEAAIKLAHSRTGRQGILAARNAFHGLTLAGMSATDTEFFQRGFGAPVSGFSYVPFGDLEALEYALKAQPDYFAAFLVEPIQGGSGIHVAPPGFLKAALDLCRRFGVLLIVDEVQTGLGRTGTLFACEAEDVTPDIMTLAKALGGGLIPIGACLYTREVYDEQFDMRHGSTFAGNTLACRAALATLAELTRDDRRLVRHVATLGEYLKEQFLRLQRDYPSLVTDIRGRGLMLGVELELEALGKTQNGLLATLQQQKLLMHLIVSYLLNVEHIRIATSFTQGNALRIEPPLVADATLCDELIYALKRMLQTLHHGDAGRLIGHLAGKRSTATPNQFDQPKPRPPARCASLRHNGGGDGAARFAFIAHPVSIGDVRRYDQSLQEFTDADLEVFRSRFAEFIKPLPIPTGELAARSANGGLADGELIMLPYLPSEIAELPTGEALALVQKAVDLAVERGAKVIGLGGFSSIVADSGVALRVPAGITITSGNSFATWAAVRAVESACLSRGLSPSDCTVAIIGAAGSIGHALSLLCAERMGKLILIGNPRAGAASTAKLRAVAEDCGRHVAELAASDRKFPAGSFADRLLQQKSDGSGGDAAVELGPIVTTDLDQHLPRAQVVFTATNSIVPLVTPRNLAQDAIVCDVSRPFNITSDLADQRPDIRILRGGLVQAPQNYMLGLAEEPDRPNTLVACAAETMILALSRYRNEHLCGRLDVTTIEEVGRLAEGMGFSVAA